MLKTLLVALLAVVAFAGVAVADNIQVVVDGQGVALDQPPILQNDRVLVPMRGVFERLGAGVVFDGQRQTITATRGSHVVQLQLGSPIAFVDGVQRTLDAPPIEVNGRTMLPLRFVGEAMGADVHWNESAQTVSIASPDVPAPVVISPPGPFIRSVVVENPGTLTAGQTLIVTLYGRPDGQATFDVGSMTGLAMAEGPPGVYKGTYTVRTDDFNLSTPVQGHLALFGRMDSKWAQSSVALEGTRPYPGYANAGGPIIETVSSSGPGPFYGGQLLTVTANGTPGMDAFFTLAGQTVPMSETATGSYVGTYRVRLQDRFDNMPILVTLRNARGDIATMTAPINVSLVGNVEIAGYRTTPLIALGGRHIVLDHPGMHGIVGGSFHVSGRADGTSVRLEVRTIDSDQLGARRLQTLIDTRQPVVATDGHFFLPVRLQGAMAGDHLEIVVHDLDANGMDLGSDRTVVTLH